MKSQSLEVLSEIRKTLSVLSIQIEKLSVALEELESVEDVSPLEDAVPVSEIEDLPETEVVELREEPEESVLDLASVPIEASDDLPQDPVDLSQELEISSQEPEESSLETGDLPQESVSVEVSDDLPQEPAPLEVPDDLPQEPVDLSQDIDIDADEMKLPDVQGFQWMIDIPGSKVANVISAISLNDRVLLINTLFHENPELFQQTISKFNSMESLSEAISYVLVTFPEWNLNSDVVYRLMMAVRRRLG